jgi:23S rRNA (adenine-N6)-dimethyltransferase
VDRLLSRGSHLLGADLILQRQLARRLVEGRAPGAGRWRRVFELEVVRPLPRSAFRPAPRVDSVVLRIVRR